MFLPLLCPASMCRNDDDAVTDGSIVYSSLPQKNERKRDRGVWGMGIKRGRSNGKWIYKTPSQHCVCAVFDNLTLAFIEGGTMAWDGAKLSMFMVLIMFSLLRNNQRILFVVLIFPINLRSQPVYIYKAMSSDLKKNDM